MGSDEKTKQGAKRLASLVASFHKKSEGTTEKGTAENKESEPDKVRDVNIEYLSDPEAFITKYKQKLHELNQLEVALFNRERKIRDREYLLQASMQIIESKKEGRPVDREYVHRLLVEFAVEKLKSDGSTDVGRMHTSIKELIDDILQVKKDGGAVTFAISGTEEEYQQILSRIANTTADLFGYYINLEALIDVANEKIEAIRADSERLSERMQEHHALEKSIEQLEKLKIEAGGRLKAIEELIMRKSSEHASTRAVSDLMTQLKERSRNLKIVYDRVIHSQTKSARRIIENTVGRYDRIAERIRKECGAESVKLVLRQPYLDVLSYFDEMLKKQDLKPSRDHIPEEKTFSAIVERISNNAGYITAGNDDMREREIALYIVSKCDRTEIESASRENDSSNIIAGYNSAIGLYALSPIFMGGNYLAWWFAQGIAPEKNENASEEVQLIEKPKIPERVLAALEEIAVEVRDNLVEDYTRLHETETDVLGPLQKTVVDF
jgi:hypothetical protein